MHDTFFAVPRRPRRSLPEQHTESRLGKLIRPIRGPRPPGLACWHNKETRHAALFRRPGVPGRSRARDALGASTGHSHRDRRSPPVPGGGVGGYRHRAGRRPCLRRAGPGVARQRHHQRRTTGQGPGRQGPLRGHLRHHQAGGPGACQRPDVARGAQPGRAAAQCAGRTRQWRHRPHQRLAGRQRRGHPRARHRRRGPAALAEAAHRPHGRWIARHGRCRRPHRQPLGRGLAATDRADQSGTVQADEPGHARVAAGLAHG
jgi:hypothetical protein